MSERGPRPCMQCGTVFEPKARGVISPRCPECRRRYRVQQRRDSKHPKTKLTLVLGEVLGDAPETGDVEGPDELPSAEAGVSPSPGVTLVSDVVRRELEELTTTHPMQESLAAAALVLAAQIDHPQVRMDARAIPRLVAELRATIGTLLEHREAEGDDIFGHVGAPSLVHPA